MALRPCSGGKFTVLGENGAPSIPNTLAQRLIPCVDHIRDLYTKFGVRPYIIRQVWTRWSQGERGEGVEDVVRTVMILPTPRIDALTALDKQSTVIGDEEFGELMVSEISGRYTEDELCGRGPQGESIADDLNFYYEIEFPDQHNEHGPATRRRFSVSGVPSYSADTFQWKMLLMRAGENRLRNGTPED